MCLAALAAGQLTVTELYLDVLTPALNRLVFPEQEQDDMIWKEHSQSACVRTIIEASFPYVYKERDAVDLKTDIKVLVICPEEEEHELGARMAADIFTIWGFQTTFVGARTPAGTLIKAVESIQPDIMTFSITNYFNLVAAKRTIEMVRKTFEYPYEIFVGGTACSGQTDSCSLLDADRIICDLTEIEQIRKEMKI
jgi:methanogenic corrinoid protein MtbC1